MKGINLSQWALKERSIIVFLIIVTILAGVFAFSRLGRNEDPGFTIKTMVVQAAWPGASVDETLKQVTERLERTLQEVRNIDNVRSFTRAGVTTIFVTLLESTPPDEVADTWYQVRKHIGDMRLSLPAGVVGPGFNDEFGDTFGIIYGFTSDGFSQRELRDQVEEIRSRLINVKDVGKIELLGAQDERIFIEFSMKQLATLGLDRNALLAALQAQNVVRPAGIIQTGNDRVALRVTGAFDNEEDIRDINFSVSGRILRLGDVAEVTRAYADPPQPMFRVNGKQSLGLAISMKDGGDILALGSNIRKEMRNIMADVPVGIDATLVADQPATVDNAISDFLASLWQAVAIILVVSFLSLGIRPGIVIAIAIPITLAAVFAIMNISGIDMQRVSLGALIIALALLVDDAMTTTDAMLNRLTAGDDKESAAAFAFRNYAFAMLSGTLITIAGFIPVGFAASAAGEYTYSLFAVVAIALIASWFVAVLFTPLFGIFILKKPAGPAKTEPGPIISAYRRLLEGAIRLRWLTIGLTIGLFVLSLAALPLVSRQFFPSSDRPELLVDLTLPQNSSIYASQRAVERLEGTLKDDADVAHWSSYVGRGAIRFYLPLNAQLPNDFFSQFVIVTKGVEERERLRVKLETVLAEEFPEAVTRVYPLELGPPVGWPVQYRVSGPDPDRVRDHAMVLAKAIGENSSARLINFDWNEPAREVRIHINQDQARILGLSSSTIAAVLNSVVTGSTITQMRDDIYLLDVAARASDDERVSLSGLAQLQVPLPSGRTVPLSQFATLEYAQAYPLIWRRDRVPTLTVQADVPDGVLPETVVAGLEPSIDALRKTLPAGYRIDVGGTVEQSEKSLASVIAVVPVMILAMLAVLMFQLKSFGRLTLALSVAPLGLIGVVAALLLANMPLGFVTILGIVALIGIIMKNAVILIGQIDAERASGKDVRTAAIDACTTRFRPIMLTAISTILGMIPIVTTIFWGPMAAAIMGGLLAATLLTLIFLPTAYVALISDS
ncbi:efflux RND transporter permease subunit [Brucellaceae bacterium D45D]